jgi:predicted glycosyltransferase involved in capsule biosynthesis
MATNERILILNDDLLIDASNSLNFFYLLETALENEPHAFKINGSFSHFVVSKTELIKVGFFDERLLGIGEEDGDFVWRYYEAYGREIPSIDVVGISNTQSTLADSGFKKGIGHYSKFNRNFIKNEKYQDVIFGGYKGMFDKRSKKKLIDETQYPYEAYYLKNREKL